MEWIYLRDAAACEREIGTPVFPWNVILLLKIELLRKRMISYSIFEMALFSVCSSDSLCGFAYILAQRSHDELFKGQKQASHIEIRLVLFFFLVEKSFDW